MTTIATAPQGLTVKVEYADPAGSCAGWFLHSVQTGYTADTSYPYTYWASGSGSFSDFANAGAKEAIETIKARLARMFGSSECVTYTVTRVDGITPAVVDTSS